MRLIRPRGILSGFLVDRPHPAVEALRQYGEHWAPGGWRVDEHAHRLWELYYQAQGSSCWRSGGRTFSVETGQGYLVTPRTRHRSLWFSRGAQHFYFAEFDLRAWWTRPSPLEPVNGFRVLPKAQALEPLFRLLMAEGGRSRDPGQAGMLGHLLGLLTLQTERLMDPGRAGEPLPQAAATPAGVLRAQALLEDNPRHDWKLEELARLAGLSPNYLSTVFRRTFGMPPMRYLLDCRINHARHLLHASDLSITAIAAELGFSSLQHFSTRFREHTGTSPSYFRKKEQAESLI